MDQLAEDDTSWYVHVACHIWALSNVLLGNLLQKRLAAARKDAQAYKEAFEDFKEDLQEEHVKAWTEEVVAWEKDTSLPDPYDTISTGGFYLLSVAHRH